MNKRNIILVGALIAGVSAQIARSELTMGKTVDWRTGERMAIAVAQNEHIYRGALVCVSNILAYEAADIDGYAVLGIALNEVDQTGDAYDSTAQVVVQRGVCRLDNAGAFTLAHIGQIAYVYDDEAVTTAAIATNDVPAGIVVDVDSSGVWIDISSLNRALAGNFTTLAVTGSGTIGDDLTVTDDAAIGGDATITGTLEATGQATLMAAPKFVAVTAAADQTLTATNGPAVTANAAPAWVTIQIGSDDYVVPAWALDAE